MICVFCQRHEAKGRSMMCAPCLEESVASTGGDHSPLLHRAPMRCRSCGKEASRCACTDLRQIGCLSCGFTFLTGGPSLSEMPRAAEPKLQ